MFLKGLCLCLTSSLTYRLKNNLKITLTELHVGACSTIATMAFDEKDPATEFLEALQRSRPRDAKKFKTIFNTICAVENYINQGKFKNLGNGIYEIKIHGLRLYSFKDASGDLDEYTGNTNQLILTCCGGSKNTKGEQTRDIKKALELKRKYLNAKKQDDTELEYIQPDDEN